MKKILLIDFLNLMHRAFHAYPKDFQTTKGLPTNAVYGFSNMLLTYLGKINPTHILVAYEDDEVPTFRSTEYTGYKANRTWAEEKPEEAELFYQQVPWALKVLKSLNIPYVKCNGYEADDIIGTLAKKLPKDFEVVILSNDQDFLQLTKYLNVKVLRPARPPFVKEKLFDKKEVIKKFGFEPDKIPDYKGLRGDPSDNIPGVKGIGDKTAKELIKKFGTVENIYKNIEKIESKRTQKLLAENAEEAVLSKKLALIDTECPIDIKTQEYKIEKIDADKAHKIFKELEFKSLIKKLENLEQKPVPKKKQKDIDPQQPSLFN